MRFRVLNDGKAQDLQRKCVLLSHRGHTPLQSPGSGNWCLGRHWSGALGQPEDMPPAYSTYILWCALLSHRGRTLMLVRQLLPAPAEAA